ncbi:hypothetical protein KP509_07G026300 [Ceratopteris richardii]|nr:hypothetical protein KP509_07G026300 [Ceratopteris richardii]
MTRWSPLQEQEFSKLILQFKTEHGCFPGSQFWASKSVWKGAGFRRRVPPLRLREKARRLQDRYLHICSGLNAKQITPAVEKTYNIWSLILQDEIAPSFPLQRTPINRVVENPNPRAQATGSTTDTKQPKVKQKRTAGRLDSASEKPKTCTGAQAGVFNPNDKTPSCDHVKTCDLTAAGLVSSNMQRRKQVAGQEGNVDVGASSKRSWKNPTDRAEQSDGQVTGGAKAPPLRVDKAGTGDHGGFATGKTPWDCIAGLDESAIASLARSTIRLAEANLSTTSTTQLLASTTHKLAQVLESHHSPVHFPSQRTS